MTFDTTVLTASLMRARDFNKTPNLWSARGIAGRSPGEVAPARHAPRVIPDARTKNNEKEGRAHEPPLPGPRLKEGRDAAGGEHVGHPRSHVTQVRIVGLRSRAREHGAAHRQDLWRHAGDLRAVTGKLLDDGRLDRHVRGPSRSECHVDADLPAQVGGSVLADLADERAVADDVIRQSDAGSGDR